MSTQTQKGRWYWLLALPFAGLLFPAVYAREQPELHGIPFFYWYQFAWIVVTALLTGFVYSRTRTPRDEKDIASDCSTDQS